MSEVVFCILMALIEYQGTAHFSDIECASGFTSDSFYGQARRLLSRGWISHPYYGCWMITERGKIALAVEVGRRTKQRYEAFHDRHSCPHYHRPDSAARRAGAVARR